MCCSASQLLSLFTGPFPTTKQEGMRMAVADVFASLRLNSTGFLPVCERERQKETNRARTLMCVCARVCACGCLCLLALVFC